MATPTDPAIPASPGIGGGGVATTARLPIFNDGDPQQRMISIADLRTEMGEAGVAWDSISQTITYDEMTDVTTTGTLQMTDSLPVGAIVIATKLIVSAGFAGDTSAVLTVGDGSDADRYHTGTPDVFTTAATGVQTGVPSGDRLITTANAPTCIVTTATDYTSVSAGSFTITIYFLRTIAA